jgi:hypothetical protein
MPIDRLELARGAYRRAIALARARSTPSSWRRLVRAARNLAAALPEREAHLMGPLAGTADGTPRLVTVVRAPIVPRPPAPLRWAELGEELDPA